MVTIRGSGEWDHKLRDYPTETIEKRLSIHNALVRGSNSFFSANSDYAMHVIVSTLYSLKLLSAV